MHDQLIHVIFFSASTCVQFETAVFPDTAATRNSGAYVTQYTDHTGHMQVLYTDYSHALVYECMTTVRDEAGTEDCGAGDQTVTIYSR